MQYSTDVFVEAGLTRQAALEAYAAALDAEMRFWRRARHQLHDPDVWEEWVAARLRTDKARALWQSFI